MKRAKKGDKRVVVKKLPTGRYFVTQQTFSGRGKYMNSGHPEPCYADGLIEVIERLQA